MPRVVRRLRVVRARFSSAREFTAAGERAWLLGAPAASCVRRSRIRSSWPLTIDGTGSSRSSAPCSVSRAAIWLISSSERSKPKMSKFSAILSARTDFGIATMPR